MASDRAKQLQKLSMQLPQANQEVAQGAEQARIAQLQQTIKKAPSTAGPGMAQQLGAQQQQQAGAAQLGAAQKLSQQQAQLGQQALSTESRTQRQKGFERELAVSEKQQAFANRLNNLDSRLKNSLLDQQLSFKTDEAGRQLMNERQFLDWAIIKAQDKEEFLNYQQTVNNIHERKIKTLQAAQAKIEQTIRQGYIQKGKVIDREMKEELARAKAAMDKRIEKEKADKANRSSIWTTVGTLGGAAAGAYFGGDASSAALGATAGGAAGTFMAGATS